MQWLFSRCYTTGALIKYGGGAPVPAPLDRSWSNLVTGVGPYILLNCPMLPSSVYSVAIYSQKSPKLCNFQILTSLVAPPSLLHKKSNTGAHLQTFQLSNGTKLVSQIQLLHGDMAFTNSVFPTMWQTKKTNKTHGTFYSPGGVQSPSPTKLGMMIEEVRHILGGLKHVPLQLTVLPLGDVENFLGKMTPAWLNPYNFGTPWPNLTKF